MFNNWLFFDDFVEMWIKIRQRGFSFILSKFNFNSNYRTITSFSTSFQHANWWIIPRLRERQNYLITGHRDMSYESYISDKYLSLTESAQLISIGCGSGSHEIMLATMNPRLKITGYDFAQDQIHLANQKVVSENLKNIEFIKRDIYQVSFDMHSVDIFLFNASLHHISDIHHFIKEKIKPALKPGGLIIINEYVGPDRMNFSDEQMKYCDEVLNAYISKENRKILGTNIIKSHCYRLGRLRMLISDPSECVDSSSILPVLRLHFEEVEFKPLGGNILMPVLKHIAHHFVNDHYDQLQAVIDCEETYLQNHPSDFVFAIYRKK